MALSPEQMKALEGQLRSGDAAGALAAAEAALAQQPEGELHYFAAVAARYAGDFDRAQGHLDALKRLQPDFGRAYQEQGHLLRLRGDGAGALAAYERACALNPALRASFTHRIALAKALGDHAQATLAEAQLGALDALPQPLQIVVSLLSEGKLRAAEQHCRAFLKGSPKHAEGMRLLADIAQRLGELADAEFLLESVLAFQPDHITARIDYLRVLRKRQKFEAARAEAAKLLATAPDNPQYQSIYAIECMQCGDYDTALETFDAVLKTLPEGWTEIDSTRIDWPSKIDTIPNPYDFHDREPKTEEIEAMEAQDGPDAPQAIKIIPMPLQRKEKFDAKTTYIRLPSHGKVVNDPALYAHASRVLHQEANPYNAKTLVQRHDTLEVWVNPPPIPLETEEMDWVFDLPYQRRPHPSYGDARIPAYDMIKTSVNIMRGCFGGCTFCSITEHEGRIIQSRSEESILSEIEKIRDMVPGFTGTISDLGGPTANMYKLNCKSPAIQRTCKRLSCVYPSICKHLETDHSPTTQLYRKARAIPGVKRVAIASGLRYDLALRDPEYVEELVTHHVGGYLKIAPEHSEDKTLSKMMKPSISAYDDFKRLFDKFSKKAGKEQYLIPYFIAAHPGSDEEDMLNLSLWLKERKFKPDQVQTFYPSPMALATAMYYSERNPLEKVRYKSDKVRVSKSLEQRRLQKAFLRYHDEKNWPMLRTALTKLGRSDLIGNEERHLVPHEASKARAPAGRGKSKTGARAKSQSRAGRRR